MFLDWVVGRLVCWLVGCFWLVGYFGLMFWLIGSIEGPNAPR